MPADNIHDLFSRSDEPALGTIDTTAVIRRSRRRRLPARLATGGALVLALGGVGVLGVQALLVSPQADTVALIETASEEDGLMFTDEDAGVTRDHLGGHGATTLNLCAAPVADVEPAASGLELTVDFPDATAGSDLVEGIVTLTNTGDTSVTGTTAASPQITLAQNGIVTWHSNGAMIALAAEIDLAPGESFDYAASFTPVVCGPADDAAEGFRVNLPAAPAGAYEVSAAIDVLDGDTVELVTGPSSTVTLR